MEKHPQTPQRQHLLSETAQKQRKLPVRPQREG